MFTMCISARIGLVARPFLRLLSAATVAILLMAVMSGCKFDSSALTRVEQCDPNGEPCNEGFCSPQGFCVSEPPNDAFGPSDIELDGDATSDVVVLGCGTGEACPPGLQCCDQQCVDLDSSPVNCGVCGESCGFGQDCLGGVCVCESTQLDCDGDPQTGCEVEPATSNTHCGDCNRMCTESSVCGNGLCLCNEALCDLGELCCDTGMQTSCVDPLGSPEHCGGCGVSCRQGEVCNNGSCGCPDAMGVLGAGCGATEKCCEGVCVDEGSDCPCGLATNMLFCTAEELCCFDGTAMEDTCVNTRTDVSNCGACGVECPPSFECNAGACRCPMGQNDCNGSCVDLLTATENCNACGNDCTTAANVMGGTCAAGACAYACNKGFEACDGDPDNGCETDTTSDNAHCGGCNNSCSGLPNVTTAQCTMGGCVISQCDVGFEDCDGSASNGCESQGCRVTTDLIAFYPLTDGTGTTVTDQSGFGAALDLDWSGAGVAWLSGRNGVQVTQSKRITVDPASKLYDEVSDNGTDAFTLEAWIKPANLTQSGPARIVTYSNSQSDRNVTLGQVNGRAVVRLRVNGGTTSNNGTLGNGSAPLDANVMETNEIHLVTTYANGTARLFKNGVEVDTANVGGDLTNWDSGYGLGLANEFSDNRPWLGEIYLVAFYRRALTPAEIQQNFGAGSFIAP